MTPLEGQTFIRWKPVGLYNGMIAPLTHYPIKGVVWYQGESNVSRTQEYRKLLPALIEDWRKKWKDNFPFLLVQLPNFMNAASLPGESSWAEFREVQSDITQVANTGMAITIDLGEWNDIHPLNKRDVGKRLAHLAMKIVYHENIAGESPAPLKAAFRKNNVTITFSNVNGGLVVRGDSVGHVAISGDGKKFIWARTKIKNNKLVVWHESIRNPSAVRYAWADNPKSANLYNVQGFPARPFDVRKGSD